MALRNIYVEGDPILRKVCRPVEKFDEKLHKLLDDMAETMYNANGVGLAAPQVGILRRVLIIDSSLQLIKDTYLLEEGDSIYYDSIVPHHVHAYEGQAAKILAVVYTPI